MKNFLTLLRKQLLTLEEKGIPTQPKKNVLDFHMLGVSLLKQVINTGSYSKQKHVLQSKLIPRQSSKG